MGLGNSTSRSEMPSTRNSDSGSFSKTLLKPHKMMFVANMGLKMKAGKLAAQVGHATLGVYWEAMKSNRGKQAVESWKRVGQMKIVVKGEDENHLMALQKQAKELGLFTHLVYDAGHTQIPAGSMTILGLFGPAEELDKVTGSLKLL